MLPIKMNNKETRENGTIRSFPRATCLGLESRAGRYRVQCQTQKVTNALRISISFIMMNICTKNIFTYIVIMNYQKKIIMNRAVPAQLTTLKKKRLASNV